MPDPIVDQIIDSSKNFVTVCPHAKVEDSFFPALEKGGLPREDGLIVGMLVEVELTKQPTAKLEKSVKGHIQTVKSDALLANTDEYIDHVAHLVAKEDHRVFVISDWNLEPDRADQ